jgi:hypothetical protein
LTLSRQQTWEFVAAFMMSSYAGVPPAAEFLEKARTNSRRAVELDDSLAEAHTARAVVAQNLDWD